MRSSILAALLLTSCSAETTQTVAPADAFSELSCFRKVVALLAKVHPNDAECIRQKIEKGEAFTDLERQLLLEGIDRLRAAGKCLVTK